MSIEQAYEERLEERRRYVRERYGSDLTDPQADYLAEAEAQALRERQEGIYEAAVAIARGDASPPQGSKRYKRKKALFTQPRRRGVRGTSP